MHVDKVTTSIPAPANALQKQLTEVAAALTSLPKTKPKAAAHVRVLTSAENLKIIEEQQKEKDLKKGHQKQKKRNHPAKKLLGRLNVPLKTRQQVCQVRNDIYCILQCIGHISKCSLQLT